MKRGVLLLLLLVASTALADEFDVSIYPKQLSVQLDEIAEFDIEIEHDLPAEQSFDVFSTDVVWNLRTEEPMLVKPSIPFKTKLFVRPLNVNPGLYSVALNFRMAGTNDVEKTIVLIETLSPESPDQKYLPAVRGTADAPASIDPREGMKLFVSLENQNKRDLEKVDVKLRSKLVNKDYSTTLGPLEKKKLTFVADLDPRTKPQDDTLYISIIVPEKEKAYQFDILPMEFEITSYGGVSEQKSSTSSFLRHEETVTLSNDGNIPATHDYKIPMSFFTKWFVSSDLDYSEESGAVSWNVLLDVNESETFVVKYNYRPLFWLFIVLVVITGAYYIFRSPIVVQKRASIVGTREGGINEMKVYIELINRSRSAVKKVKVMDLVPKIADVVTEHKPHMLTPSLSKVEKGATLVRWNLDVLEPQEQRILVYRMRSKLTILGGVKLPVTAVKYKTASGEREVVSEAPEIDMQG